MTCAKSWNEEINKTLAMAGVTFEDVPQQPERIEIAYFDGKRQIYRHGNNLYVVGMDALGRCTTHFVDRDSFK